MMATSSRSSSCASLHEVVVDLAAAQEDASHAFAASRVVGNDSLKSAAAKSSSGDTTLRVPQQALGRHHHQRLAPRPQHLPPQHVEVLRGRGGDDDLDVVLGGQRQEPLQPALECSGPCPSKPCGSSSTRPLSRRHLSSALAMNWSMITWAALTKSPNCASHSTSAVGAVEAVAVLEAQHAGLGQRAVDDLDRRLVVGQMLQAACSVRRSRRRAARRGAG